ncbi:hypothetical protein ACOSP7_001041 [Xanthoceras sorbifolium]
MISFRFNGAYNLRRAVSALSSLAETATVFYSADAISLLATHPDRHVIAALRILPTSFGSSKCRESAVTGVDIVKLYRYLNNSRYLDVAILYGEEKDVKYTLAMKYYGREAYRIIELELLQPSNDHINFENQERKYDVKIGILSTEFRDMTVRLAAIGSIADVTITENQVMISAGDVQFVLRKELQQCTIEGDIDHSIHFQPHLDYLISIGEGIALSERSSDKVSSGNGSFCHWWQEMQLGTGWIGSCDTHVVRETKPSFMECLKKWNDKGFLVMLECFVSGSFLLSE